MMLWHHFTLGKEMVFRAVQFNMSIHGHYKDKIKAQGTFVYQTVNARVQRLLSKIFIVFDTKERIKRYHII